ncbi:hypothetical protein QAD02_011729 [Eretmocerus hayati]|uniref:Uncharacterized protein n=1 Tax=Eretmocerus hayati TaxID=131215 RepID=A0ACC2NYJ1_9HYME|nr:hypothetical protein QAD02_011729 [Eretmocerus hayati]
MEASLGGSKLGSRSGTHFSIQDYEQIGKAFCETLLDFSDSDPIKEKLRNKIIARLAKEGSSADEPTNIELTDYSSDEGDTSDDSYYDENNELYHRRFSSCIEDRRYLCVPPPSPAFLKPATAGTPRKKKKLKSGSQKNTVKKKIKNRKVLDLPTTEPGSDLHEFSDSADEHHTFSAAEMKNKSSDDESRTVEKENRREKSDLPVFVRPRSLSLGEEFISADLKKCKRRLRRHRLPRTLRNLSPVIHKNQDVQIKLLSLRRQIWTGLGNYDLKDSENFEMPLINNYPLSWGVSRMAFGYHTDNEALLESCSRKLEELNYDRIEVKKPKKKIRKKVIKDNENSVIDSLQEDKQITKKKKPRLKQQKTLKSSLGSMDNNAILITADGMDSLKLCGTPKIPKMQSKQKSETKKKSNKVALAAGIATSKMKSKVPTDSVGDSSGSENTPHKIEQKITKKRNSISTGKKRTQSSAVSKKETK